MMTIGFYASAAVAVAIFAAGIAVSASASAEESVGTAVCGKCRTYSGQNDHHDFSQCQQLETHGGECTCGGGDCHLSTEDGECDGCGHGNCPETDNELPDDHTAEEHLLKVLERDDATGMAKLAFKLGSAVNVNSDRQALQLLDCAGEVSIHIPLSDSDFRTLTTTFE